MTCHAARRVSQFELWLDRDRREVWRALASTDAELADFERHQPGEFTDDAATATTCRILASIEERDCHALAEIDAAVTRLAAGKFGLCEACALPIPLGRLRAVPTARLCVTCEERAEQANQRLFKT
jgi:RNA polymerase-binding transcription factor